MPSTASNAASVLPTQPSRAFLERLTEPAHLVMFGVLLLAVVALFCRWFVVQNDHSWGNEDWQHAYIVPLISGWLVWRRRHELERVEYRVFWPGLVPLLMGIWSYVYFIAGVPNHFGQGLALVLTVFGLTLLLLGPRAMEQLFLPIAFLVFGITVPEIVMNYLTYPLQDIAARGGYFIMRMAGINADLAGNVITVPDAKSGVGVPLNIAMACSGMRTVIGFLALGTTVALVVTRLWWKRVVLVALAVPVGVFLNAVRIAVLGYLSQYNADLASGQAHMLIGTLLLVPGLLLYLFFVWSLNQAVPEQQAKPVAKKSPPGKSTTTPPKQFNWGALPKPAFVAATLLLLISAACLSGAISGFKLYTRKLPIQARFVCSSIPTKTASWEQVGADHLIGDPEELKTLGTENYLTRTYVERNPPPGQKPAGASMHIAYYTGQVDTVPHVPDRCNVAAGAQIIGGPWTIRVPLKRDEWLEDAAASSDTRRALGIPDATIYNARLGPDSHSPGSRVRLPRGIENLELRVFEFQQPGEADPQFAGYFFIANGGLTSSAQGVRLLAFDLKSDYAYYMKVQFSTTRIKGGDDLAQLAGSILDEMLPDLMLCVPDWTEVIRGDYPADNPRRRGARANP